IFFLSSRRRHTRSKRDWSSDVCSSDLDIRKYNKVESQTIHVISLLTSSGISHVFTNVVENFTSFVALGPVLVAMLGVGVAEKTEIGRASCREVVECNVVDGVG